MKRWHIPDATALELIEFPGKLGMSGKRPRFRFTTRQQRITSYLPEIDAALVAAGKDQVPESGRAGRTPEELAREFEPTAQSIRNWVAQSESNAGRGNGGLTTAEREELCRLRRENRQLRLEREILSKAAAWFARETNAEGRGI